MTTRPLVSRLAGLAVTCLIAAPVGILTSAPAMADNTRFNNGVVSDVYTLQRQVGCPKAIHVSPQLRLAAQWHANDVLNNRDLDGDVGSDGSTPRDRAAAAGFRGAVSQAVAINPALAMSGIELINQWYYNPDYLAMMRNCANSEIGVWSENSLDRTVVVAVFGIPDAA
jgi:uncharacterized protein YkwD